MYNRRQQVSVVSIKSDDMVITRGVPQGSALDKLTTSVIETHSLTFTFLADCINLFYANRIVSELEVVVNSNLK